jgi:hypothetical protein
VKVRVNFPRLRNGSSLHTGPIYPEDWEEIILSKDLEEILKRFGLGLAFSVATPAKLLARTAAISCAEFRILNPIKFARVGDSNVESVEHMRTLLPPSSKPEEVEVKIQEKRFTEKVGKITIPPRLDYDARQVGEAPMGLGGKLTTGAHMLPKAENKIKQMVEETENYFNVAAYGAGFEVRVRSLGGTETLNLASEILLHQSVKPKIRLSIWIIDEKHPNLLPLLAYRLKAGFRENELIMLRVNEGNLTRGDVALARAVVGLLSQYGQRGKPDASTIVRTLTDKYRGIVSYDFAEVKIPVFPTKVRDRTKHIGIPWRFKTVIRFRKSDQMTRIIGERMEEFSEGSNGDHLFVLGSFKSDECDEIEKDARLYVEKGAITTIPCGSWVKAYGNYCFMTATIVKFTDGYTILKKIFNYNEPGTIPDDILEKVINDKKSDDVTKGLEMASRYFGLDVLDFVKGGQK